MIKFIIKLFISLAILLLLVYASDLAALEESFKSIRSDAIVYALLLMLLIRYVMALRWKVLLNYYQIDEIGRAHV